MLTSVDATGAPPTVTPVAEAPVSTMVRATAVFVNAPDVRWPHCWCPIAAVQSVFPLAGLHVTGRHAPVVVPGPGAHDGVQAVPTVHVQSEPDETPPHFRANWFADNGMIPALLMLEHLGREKRPLSAILAPMRERYHISGEINSRVEDVAAALARLEARYRDGRIHKLDGISVDYDQWHFNVRPSNTEPLLRLNLESLVSRDDMERKRDQVLELIRA